MQQTTSMSDYILKDIFFNEPLTKEFASIFKKIYPAFKEEEFVASVLNDEWEGKELKQRMRHVTLVLHDYLPKGYQKVTALFKKLVTHLIKERPTKGSLYFEYMFLPDYIEYYGLNDFENSMDAIELITQYSSAEFALRPFLLKYPEKMNEQMTKWATHEDHWVRRLATEGYRPRLPWGTVIARLREKPQQIIPILETLKDDPSLDVRRSVANNLNDISKDHPELVLEIGKKWIGKSDTLDWVVKHGLRTLLKQGNTEAMLLFGFANPKNIEISNLQIKPKEIQIGNEAIFSFHLDVKTRKAAKLRLEYFVYLLKANGSLSKKIFKIKEKSYPARHKEVIAKKHSFKQFTSRTHYPGGHKLSIVVNGIEYETISFELMPE